MVALTVLLTACGMPPGTATATAPTPAPGNQNPLPVTQTRGTAAPTVGHERGLVLSEIMYNPADDAELEFVEVANWGTTALDLSGIAFVDGIDYEFPAGSSLAPGEHLLLARNAAALAAHAGVAVFGQYNGQLDNKGERLTVAAADQTPLFTVRYDDGPPWPVTANGHGFALALTPDGATDPTAAAAWQAGARGGTPGGPEPTGGPVTPGVLVNELLPHTDDPQVDAVELFNPTDAAVDVGHWFITDQRADLGKFTIPADTRIPAQGYLVFTKDDLGFAFSEMGEDILLLAGDAGGALTGYSHGFAFGASANGVSFGRYITSTGAEHFPPQDAVTLGQANQGPRVGPVVISEILAAPQPGNHDYVELTNIGTAAVPFFDPNHPQNLWRLEGLGEFAFPAGLILLPGQSLLAVPLEPADFQARYGVADDVLVVGPFLGGLDKEGDSLTLLRPDTPNAEDGTVPFIQVDTVTFVGAAPWPVPAVQTGRALQRIDPAAYGDDPTNWRAASPLYTHQSFLPLVHAGR